jgi:hypothetical protein
MMISFHRVQKASLPIFPIEGSEFPWQLEKAAKIFRFFYYLAVFFVFGMNELESSRTAEDATDEATVEPQHHFSSGTFILDMTWQFLSSCRRSLLLPFRISKCLKFSHSSLFH